MSDLFNSDDVINFEELYKRLERVQELEEKIKSHIANLKEQGQKLEFGGLKPESREIAGIFGLYKKTIRLLPLLSPYDVSDLIDNYGKPAVEALEKENSDLKKELAEKNQENEEELQDSLAAQKKELYTQTLQMIEKVASPTAARTLAEELRAIYR